MSSSELKRVKVLEQLENPDSIITFEKASNLNLLGKYAISMRGIVSGDTDKWIKKYWEIKDKKYRYLQSTPSHTEIGLGKESVIDWSTKGMGMLRPGTSNLAYGNKGVALGQMNILPATNYDGSLYDNNTATIVPHDIDHLPAIYSFSSSKKFNKVVRQIDQALKVTNP